MLPFTKGFHVYYFDPKNNFRTQTGETVPTYLTDGNMKFTKFQTE